MNSVSTVAVSSNEYRQYPDHPPFLPGDDFPELAGIVPTGDEKNISYTLVRESMYLLNMDAENFSTSHWNPLSCLIRPGQRVLIKPNLVRHFHLTGGDYNAVVTHGSVLRCLLDYAAKALKGKGEITVGDAPVQSADFNKLVSRTGLMTVCENVSSIWNIPVNLLDLRLSSVQIDAQHRVRARDHLKGDPKGYRTVDLKDDSLLSPLNDHFTRFRVTSYNSKEMLKHHSHRHHEYLIPQSVLDADVVINVPKLKTHRKVGLTACLKNMVGINGHKDWLPHHRVGPTCDGGDEYQKRSYIKKLHSHLCETFADETPSSSMKHLHNYVFRAVDYVVQHMSDDAYTEGSWYGNDTLWRTVLDLNRVLFYADKAGVMRKNHQRKCISFVDGIVAGDGEGPMEPNARKCGILVVGLNPVAVDSVLATLVGFDYSKIPLISNGFHVKPWPLTDFGPERVIVHSKNSTWTSITLGAYCKDFRFSPPSGWANFIESAD